MKVSPERIAEISRHANAVWDDREKDLLSHIEALETELEEEKRQHCFTKDLLKLEEEMHDESNTEIAHARLELARLRDELSDTHP